MSQRRQLIFLPIMLLPRFSAAAEINRYKGEYFFNFENAVFSPEGSEERWAVKGDMRVAESAGPGGTVGWGTSIVTVEGSIGPLGRFGNLGSCSRILTVTKVIAVHSKRSSE